MTQPAILTKGKTAREIIREAYQHKPAHVRYAINGKETVIGGWMNDQWVPVAFYTLLDDWAPLTHQILVNGQPIVTEEGWTEVER